MGIDQKVLFAAERLPSWPRVAKRLAALQFPIQMRMIDGQLAFPDEEPPAEWRELRIAAGPGMVSLVRDREGINLVIWGNADRPLRETWNAISYVLAELTEGRVRTSQGESTAAEFRKQAELPDTFVEDVS